MAPLPPTRGREGMLSANTDTRERSHQSNSTTGSRAGTGSPTRAKVVAIGFLQQRSASSPGWRKVALPDPQTYNVTVHKKSNITSRGGITQGGFMCPTGSPFRVIFRFGSLVFTLIVTACGGRSEEHTSELQSQSNLVCRLLLEKKKKK